ncbi:MAG: TIGR03668 family PPOX class F420-dependent oxidoreductase [Candidatus Binatia bacterium]
MTRKEKAFVQSGRVAHLATADGKGRPLNVPFCYVLSGKGLYSPIDEKPKITSPLLLRRIQNILVNAHVSVVVDRYDDDWERLAYVIITGKARVLTQGKRHRRAVALLRRKYPQYRAMAIHKRPIIHITPTHWRSWGAL